MIKEKINGKDIYWDLRTYAIEGEGVIIGLRTGGVKNERNSAYVIYPGGWKTYGYVRNNFGRSEKCGIGRTKMYILSGTLTHNFHHERDSR